MDMGRRGKKVYIEPRVCDTKPTALLPLAENPDRGAERYIGQKSDLMLKELSDEKLITEARLFIQLNNITTRTELLVAWRAMYSELKKRDLFDAVGLVIPTTMSMNYEGRKPDLDLKKLSDEKLKAEAKAFMRLNNITTRTELIIAWRAMYNELKARGLFDAVGLTTTVEASMYSMTKDQLVRHTIKSMRDDGLETPEDLMHEKWSLFQQIKRKGLLPKVFCRGKVREIPAA